MSGHGPHDPQAARDAADAKAVDDLTQSRFHTKPVADRSGMLLPSDPTNAEATEDEQVDAYMARHFPGSVR